MANLLPSKESASLGLERRQRLRASVFGLVAWLAGLGAIVLIPTGLALFDARDSVEQRLEATRALIERAKEAHAGTDLAVTKEKMEILTANAAMAVPHEHIGRIVDLAPPGIALEQVAFMRGEDVVTLAVSGGAMSRAALIAFGDALRGSGLFTEVTIPIESLAPNTNLRFRLTLTLAEEPQPSL